MEADEEKSLSYVEVSTGVEYNPQLAFTEALDKAKLAYLEQCGDYPYTIKVTLRHIECTSEILHRKNYKFIFSTQFY